jgi:hypothetical protein
MAEDAKPAPKKPARRDRVGSASIEIADQVDQVRELLIEGYRPNQIRKICAERWGLTGRTAEYRMQTARRMMTADLEGIDRKEITAQMIEQATEILKMARETRQLSNAIGALRFSSELLGLNQRRN